MKTIKVRAWDKQTKKYIDHQAPKKGAMLFDETIVMSTGYDSEDNPTWDWGEVEYERYEWEFFTGTFDDHGKEIWVGDLLEVWFPAPWDEEIPIRILGEVTYGIPFPGCFCFYDSKADNTCCLYELGTENGIGIVRGNIHENPELINN